MSFESAQSQHDNASDEPRRERAERDEHDEETRPPRASVPAPPKLKDYLGDSVYADMDEFGGIILTTENGLGASNTIILEPAVYLALVRFNERSSEIWKRYHQENIKKEAP